MSQQVYEVPPTFLLFTNSVGQVGFEAKDVIMTANEILLKECWLNSYPRKTPEKRERLMIDLDDIRYIGRYKGQGVNGDEWESFYDIDS